VPAPMIIISITLWLVSGALNPLEFSAGSAVFQYLPTAAGIRVLSYALFNRGAQFAGKSLLILCAWFAGVLLLFFGRLAARRRKRAALGTQAAR